MFNFLCISTLIINGVIQGDVITPNYNFDDYYQDGDLLLGALLPLTLPTKSACDGPMILPAVQMFHVIRYIINKTNADPDILPNVTVGIAALNDCYRSNTALVKAMQFIPHNDENPYEDPRLSYNKNSTLRPSYSVFGVIGNFASSRSQVATSLLFSLSLSLSLFLFSVKLVI